MGNNCPAGDTTVLRSTPEYVNRISAQISGISIPDHATPGTNNYARGRAGLSPHFCRIEHEGDAFECDHSRVGEMAFTRVLVLVVFMVIMQNSWMLITSCIWCLHLLNPCMLCQL